MRINSPAQRKVHRPLVPQTRTPESYPSDPVSRWSAAASDPRERRTNQWTADFMTTEYQRVRGLCHRLPRFADLSPGHSQARARSSVLQWTSTSPTSPLGSYPDPGPRFRPRGLRAVSSTGQQIASNTTSSGTQSSRVA
jgi:hypothetical protein